MARFKARVQFVFEGEIEIIADNKELAKEYIQKHTGLCLGGNIHTTMPDDEIDWNFSHHAEKVIKRITKS